MKTSVEAMQQQAKNSGFRIPENPKTQKESDHDPGSPTFRHLILPVRFRHWASDGGPAAPGPAATPADYVLLTVILRHDQSKTLDEINRELDQSGFWAKFPPEGIVIESWYIVMGIGHVVTLRVPPARLREVNRSVEQTAWKAYRSEFYPAYDAREIAKSLRQEALKKR